MNIANVLQSLMENKIIVILRGLNTTQSVKTAEALLSGGIKLIEVTFSQGENDDIYETEKSINAIIKQFGHELKVGAGTVLSLEQLKIASQSGAEFIVSPNTNIEIIQETKRIGLSSFPGALTPSEIVEAHMNGADAVKVFPASNLGPDYIKACKAPLKLIRMIAVGGIDEDNIGKYLSSGACAVGVGGNLVNKAWILNGEYIKITEIARKYIKELKRHE